MLPLPEYNYKDALGLESQLAPEEVMARDMAHAFCQDKLMPRVLLANRHEHFDPAIMREFGSLGMLGCTIDGYGCSGLSYVAYGLIAREVTVHAMW